LAITLAPAQSIGPGEIRVKSQVYVPQSRYTVRVDTRLVEMDVVVRDGHGRAVAGLTKENFQIHDNGKVREIADFAVDTGSFGPSTVTPGEPYTAGKTAPQPENLRQRFIALFIDDVNAKDGQHANDLKQTLEAAQKFVKDAVQPGVQMGVFTASGAPSLEYTADVEKLTEAIASIRPHPKMSETTCPTPYLAYLIVVRHDTQALREMKTNLDSDKHPFEYQCQQTTVMQAEETWRRARDLSMETLESIGHVADHLAEMPGARVLLMASSGFLTATLEPQRDEMISRAIHAGVVINTLDSKGLYEYLPPHTRDVRLSGNDNQRAGGIAHTMFETTQMSLRVEAMNEPLAALAEGTGGTFFHENNDLHAGFVELAAPPQVTYRLSLKLNDVPADGTYHKLKVTLAHTRSAAVQARPGYFAPVPEREGGSKFDQEVMGKDAVENFPVELSAENTKLPGGDVSVAVVAKVDISRLTFAKQRDRRTQRIRLVTAIMDSQGRIVTAKEATMDLELKEETYQRLLKSGLNAKLTLQLKPGVYALREVLEDGEGKLACSTNPIEIR
jgi:VWFA-related protein